MPHVMQPGTEAVIVPDLLFPETDLLADPGEVALCCQQSQPLSVLAGEERGGGAGSEDPVPGGTVFAETAVGAIRNGNEAVFAVLCVPDVQDGRVNIDIPVVKTDSFTDPHPGDREQAEERRAGHAPKSQARGQRCRFCQNPDDLVVGVDIGPGAPIPLRYQSLGWDFRARVTIPEPSREAAHRGQPVGPGGRARRTERVLPSQEQIDADPLRTLGIGEGDERAHPFGGGIPVAAAAAAKGDVFFEAVRERGHRIAPDTGHGRATVRSASMS